MSSTTASVVATWWLPVQWVKALKWGSPSKRVRIPSADG
jgi:hypothetical protein